MNKTRLVYKTRPVFKILVGGPHYHRTSFIRPGLIRAVLRIIGQGSDSPRCFWSGSDHNMYRRVRLVNSHDT